MCSYEWIKSLLLDKLEEWSDEGPSYFCTSLVLDNNDPLTFNVTFSLPEILEVYSIWVISGLNPASMDPIILGDGARFLFRVGRGEGLGSNY